MFSYIGLIFRWIEIQFSNDNVYKGFDYKDYYVYFKLRYGWEDK